LPQHRRLRPITGRGFQLDLLNSHQSAVYSMALPTSLIRRFFATPHRLTVAVYGEVSDCDGKLPSVATRPRAFVPEFAP
jgi:hypothetical protein